MAYPAGIQIPPEVKAWEFADKLASEHKVCVTVIILHQNNAESEQTFDYRPLPSITE